MWRMLTGRAEDLQIDAARSRRDGHDRHRQLGRDLHVRADRPQGRQRHPGAASASPRTGASPSTWTTSRSTPGPSRHWACRARCWDGRRSSRRSRARRHAGSSTRSARAEVPDLRAAALHRALELPGAVCEHPFGDDVDVLKVGGKVFVILSPGPPPRITLKVDPELGRALVDGEPAISPGLPHEQAPLDHDRPVWDDRPGARDRPRRGRLRPRRPASLHPAAPGDLMPGTCSHLETMTHVEGREGDEGCPACVATGSTWVHLRRCTACGVVGCCDDSPIGTRAPTSPRPGTR